MFDRARGGADGPQAPGLRDRLGAALAVAADLFSTRVEIFGAEASEKAAHLARGLAAFAIAVAAAFMTTFLMTALLVSLFTLLFGRVWAGILATFLLYLAAVAAAAWLGWKALSKVRPLDFPITRNELRKDWEALSRSVEAPVPPGDAEERPAAPGAQRVRPVDSPSAVDDFEARFRAGSE